MVDVNYIPPERAVENAIREQARQVRDAQRSTGTERNLVTQNLMSAIVRLEEAFGKLHEQQERLEEVITSIPYATVGFDERSNFGLQRGWQTVAATTIPRAAGMNRLSIMVIGAGSAMQMLPYSTPEVRTRVVINGVAGMHLRASQRWDSDVVNYVGTSSFGLVIANPPATVSVAFQMEFVTDQQNGDFSPRPENKAQLTAQAIFTKV